MYLSLKENFPAWKFLMKLHLGELGDHAQSTTNDMKKKKEHNKEMLDIASTLIYAEFYCIKSLENEKKLWDSLHTIYGGDTNVLRAKFESV